MVADPGPVTFNVYLPGQPPLVLRESDTFDGGEVLPGFSEPVWRFSQRRA